MEEHTEIVKLEGVRLYRIKIVDVIIIFLKKIEMVTFVGLFCGKI